MKRRGKGNGQKELKGMREKGGYNQDRLDTTTTIRNLQKLGVHFFLKGGFQIVRQKPAS